MSEFERNRHNICIATGDTWILPIAFKDAAGNPIDLTGRVVRVQVRTTKDATGVPAMALTDGDGLTFNGPAGTVDIREDVALVADDYFWELELSGGAPPTVSSPLWGSFKVEQDVVR